MRINFYFRCIYAMVFLWSFTEQTANAQDKFHLVKDITRAPFDTWIPEMKVIDGYLYFTDYDHGLMRTDGTESGTIVIEDPSLYYYLDYTATQGGFYFRAISSIGDSQTLRKTNGEVRASVAIGPTFTSIANLTELNGRVYFIADDGVHGKELWVSDGMETIMLKRFGKTQIEPRDLIICNGLLFFVADDGVHGAELWKSDGSQLGTVMVKDIYPGAETGWPWSFAVLNNELYFNARTSGAGFELWKTDGTEIGTVLIKDIANGVGDSGPYMLVAVGNTIYFEAFDFTNGRALWKTQGTAETTSLITDINPDQKDISHIFELTDVNGVLYFIGDDGIHGKELWKSDGTKEGTIMIKDLTSGALDESQLKLFYSLGGHLFFVSNSQLWKSDGDECSTVQMTFEDGISFLDFESHLAWVDNKLFVPASTKKTGGELFYYDYSSGGPVGDCWSQTITFDALPNKILGEAPFLITATSSSGLPVSFSSSDNAIASIIGNTITLHGAGEVVITATQAGDNRYLSAAPVSQTLSIKLITAVEPISSNKVTVYPNPVADYLTLQGFTSEENVKVQLYRMDGKEVDAQELSGRTAYQLDMNSLTPGIYLVTITSAKGRMSERIIKK